MSLLERVLLEDELQKTSSQPAAKAQPTPQSPHKALATQTSPTQAASSEHQKEDAVDAPSHNFAGMYFENDFDFQVAFEAWQKRTVLAQNQAQSVTDLKEDEDVAACSVVWTHIFQLRGSQQYRPRRFILKAFPEIESALERKPPPIHFVDFGSGSGASIIPLIPVLAKYPSTKVTCVDFSLPALELLKQSPEYGPDVVSILAADLTLPLPSDLPLADIGLLIFVLSAIPPPKQAQALANAASKLKTGGCLLIRDYGFCDMKHTSISETQTQGDQTLRTFFSLERLKTLVTQVPTLVLQSPPRYLTVKARNKKMGIDMLRVFIRVACEKI